jgi:Holliday junction resolvase-like predicted endonuclease
LAEDKTLFARLLVSILKGTRTGTISVQQIAIDTPILVDIAREKLSKLCNTGTLKLEKDTVTVSDSQRINFAIEALKAEADPEKVSKYLKWQEFEELTKLALDANQYQTIKHLRFKNLNRGWEIDVVGLRKPTVLSIDCKHWKRSWQRAATVNIVEKHLERTEALSIAAFSLKKKTPIQNWMSADFVPIIVTLHETPFKVYNQVPVVPVLKLRSFLNELPAYLEELKVIHVKVNKQGPQT